MRRSTPHAPSRNQTKIYVQYRYVCIPFYLYWPSQCHIYGFGSIVHGGDTCCTRQVCELIDKTKRLSPLFSSSRLGQTSVFVFQRMRTKWAETVSAAWKFSYNFNTRNCLTGISYSFSISHILKLKWSSVLILQTYKMLRSMNRNFAYLARLNSFLRFYTSTQPKV